MKKVVLGLSGGVDSSVAAALLKKEGYEVIGITFKFVDDFDETDAVSVAKTLDIEHHIIDYREIFKEKVINKFLNDYRSGITPNPCVICNKNVKLRFLLDEMYKLNADYIATGHYAKISNKGLYKSIDKNKDQTYFLCQISKDEINRILLPLEGIDKEEVRRIANEIGLDNANKKDSTDVCFIKNKFSEYIAENIETKPGNIINIKNNEILGKHKGLSYYTIGQRRGLDIGGTEARCYVVGKNIEKNILYVAIGDDNDALISDSAIIEDVNYFKDEKVKKCKAKFRYRQDEEDVELEWIDENTILVKYPQGIKSVTPGQACVFYLEDECLGGGIIKEVRKNNEKLWYL